jgi:hypothetical protein
MTHAAARLAINGQELLVIAHDRIGLRERPTGLANVYPIRHRGRIGSADVDAPERIERRGRKRHRWRVWDRTRAGEITDKPTTVHSRCRAHLFGNISGPGYRRTISRIAPATLQGRGEAVGRPAETMGMMGMPFGTRSVPAGGVTDGVGTWPPCRATCREEIRTSDRTGDPSCKPIRTPGESLALMMPRELRVLLVYVLN